MNENSGQYAIFTNKNTNRKLVYYPVAKNANSSAKLFLFTILSYAKNVLQKKSFN